MLKNLAYLEPDPFSQKNLPGWRQFHRAQNLAWRETDPSYLNLAQLETDPFYFDTLSELY